MIRRILRALTGKKPRRVRSFPTSERDWQAGDRAECIAPGCWVRIGDDSPSFGPARSQILKVAAVAADNISVWLTFPNWPNQYYPAGHFRKLRPCSAEFRQRLHRQVPVKKPELVE